MSGQYIKIQITTPFFNILYNSPFTYNPFIWHYIWVTEKSSFNKLQTNTRLGQQTVVVHINGADYISELRQQTLLLFIPGWYWMSMGSHGGIILTRGKPKNSEKNLSQCHFVRHESYKDEIEREIAPPRRQPAIKRLQIITSSYN
jgi:hypothetical protein